MRIYFFCAGVSDLQAHVIVAGNAHEASTGDGHWL
jgi:hypothetical protein